MPERVAWRAEALKVHRQFVEQIAAAGIPVTTELKSEDGHPHEGLFISKSGCQGFCQMGPLVTVEPDGILYTHVRPEDVAEIIDTTLKNNGVVDRLLYTSPAGDHCRGPAEIPFYTQQRRTVLKPCGRIDPEDIREYIRDGGYSAAQRRLHGDDAASGVRGNFALPDCEAEVAADSPRAAMGVDPSATRGRRSTSFATAMRATPARSWTAALWREIPIA